MPNMDDEAEVCRYNAELQKRVAELEDAITKRRQVEERLKESEEKFSKAFYNHPTPMIISNVKTGKRVDVNESFIQLSGFSKEELLKTNAFENGIWVDPGKLKKGLEKLIKEKAVYNFLIDIINKSGEIRNLLSNAAMLDICDGNLAIGSFVDITEQKRAEETNTRLGRILENSLNEIFIFDADTLCFIQVNRGGRKNLGYSLEELETMTPVDIKPEFSAEEFEALIQPLRDGTHDKITFETIHQRKDGSTYPIEVHLQLSASLFVAIILDITERKQAEDALRDLERRLSIRNRIAHIFLTVPDEEMYGEVLHVVLEATESRWGIFGYIDEKGAWVCPSLIRDICGQCRISDRDIVFLREQWDGIWGRAMVEKKPLYSNEPFSVHEGHIPIFRALDVPIIYHGKLIGNLLVGNRETDYGKKERKLLESLCEYIGPVLHARLQRDIKEQENRKLEAQFNQAQKMEAIGVLAGGVAHDFNNLLTSIIGSADLALMDLGKDTPGYQHIEEIRKAGQRAASLAGQLLAFSRKEMIQPEVLDLNSVMMNLEKMVRRLIVEDIELITAYAPDPCRVEADPGQMEQVIMNLSVNARDAMPKGGKLTIETANVELDERYFREYGVENEVGPYVMLAVTDSGIGMDKETQARIFEPFFTTKEIGKGTGLGLSTVYGIVKQNKGYIWVYSEEEKGTTFKVYLPRAEADTRDLKKERSSERSLRGSETILVTEDDEMLRNMARKMLEGYGYTVLTARDGKEAMEISDSHDDPIHLLLTDVVMPGMSGQDLVDKLQAKVPEIKVVYMSGYTDNVIAHHGILEEGLNFIQKPFSLVDLARKVREALDKKQD